MAYFEALLGGFSHLLSLKLRGHLSLIPKIYRDCYPQNYLSLEFDNWWQF